MASSQMDLALGLSETDAAALQALGTRLALEPGQSLFRMGTPADAVYVVERGRVALTLPLRIRDGEEEIVVEEKQAGETVGWSGLVPPHRFTLNASAAVACEVRVFARAALVSALRRAPCRRPRRHGERGGGDGAPAAGVPDDVGAGDAAHRRAPLRLSGRGHPDEARPPPGARGRRGCRPRADRAAAGGADDPGRAGRAPRAAAAAVQRRHLPVLELPRRPQAEHHPPQAQRDARRHRAASRRAAPLVPRLPRRGRPRLAAPGERRARAVRALVPAVRPVPRREAARLAGRRPRPAHRAVERAEELPAVRELPQPPPAPVQADRAEAGAAPSRAAGRTHGAGASDGGGHTAAPTATPTAAATAAAPGGPR